MGLAPFVAAYTWKAARNRDEETARIARFWTRIFAINFAAGVVTGIPMEFQFGTNWAAFSRRSGAVVGQPLAMESMFAFFLESVFLGVLLYRRRELPTMFTAWSAVLVCAGSWLSGFFIVATDAWMQHPVGYAIDPDGTIRLESIWAVLSSPFLIWQFAARAQWSAARRRIHRRGRRRILPVVAPRRSDRAAFRASRRRSSA